MKRCFGLVLCIALLCECVFCQAGICESDDINELLRSSIYAYESSILYYNGDSIDSTLITEQTQKAIDDAVKVLEIKSDDILASMIITEIAFVSESRKTNKIHIPDNINTKELQQYVCWGFSDKTIDEVMAEFRERYSDDELYGYACYAYALVNEFISMNDKVVLYYEAADHISDQLLLTSAYTMIGSNLYRSVYNDPYEMYICTDVYILIFDGSNEFNDVKTEYWQRQLDFC